MIIGNEVMIEYLGRESLKWLLFCRNNNVTYEPYFWKLQTGIKVK